MDPLSISTGIITVLQATSTLISVCYNFRAALKSAPWSLTQVIEELKCLRNILESLEELAQTLDDPSRLSKRPVFELLSDPLNGPLVLCLRELSSLEKKIKSSSYAGTTGLKRKAALQALGWQLRDRDAKECLERIERCKSILSIALAADEIAVLVSIKNMAQSLQATVQNIDHKVTIIGDLMQSRDLGAFTQFHSFLTAILIVLDSEHEAIMRWLSSIDPCESHEAAISTHQQGTGNWIIESKEFVEWYQAESSILWLSGFPGAGKTMLFSYIVSCLAKNLDENDEGLGMAYFYCDSTLNQFQDMLNLIGSLVAQLCSQFQCPEDLKLAFRSSNTPGKIRAPNLEILCQTISRFSKSHKILILVDALDECAKLERFLNFLSNLQSHSEKINILLTSREGTDIKGAFQWFSRIRLEDCRTEIDRDIKSYIDYRLDTDAGLKGLLPSLKADIRLALNKKCAGMFRWAQCQLDAISQLRTTKAIRNNLNQLPSGLNETYANILERANETDAEILRRILLWVAFAVLPLTFDELHEAVAIEPDLDHFEKLEESRLNNPQDILRLGGSLLSITETGHLRLGHLSVKDYLLSEGIKASPSVCGFAMSPKEANQELAINCLTYLSLDSLATGPSTTIESWQERLVRHPLLRHAAKGWAYYLRAAKMSPKVNDLVSRFFASESRETFMSWVQVLNSRWSFEWEEYPRHATSLYYAASFGLGDVVDDLIKRGVDLDAPGSRFGGTALHGATLRQHIPIMKALLTAGAAPSRADFNLITPLHSAVIYGNAEVISLLLDYGASKNEVDRLGETPYDWAINAGQIVSQKLLRGEVYQPSNDLSITRQDTVWQRTTALFPAMAVAQGFPLPSSKERI